VNSGVSKAKFGWIAILMIAMLATSLQAKLGLYHPEQSQEQLVSKAFKLSECRLERAVPDSPAVALMVETELSAAEAPRPEPYFPEYAVPEIRPLFQSSSHRFRPPPVRS
jgi:hypothetical protein